MTRARQTRNFGIQGVQNTTVHGLFSSLTVWKTLIRVLPVFDDLARFILDVFEDLGFVQLGHCQKKFWIVLENPSESSTTHEEQQNIQLIESITTKFSSLDIVIHYKLTDPLNATDYDNPYYEEIKDIEASKFLIGWFSIFWVKSKVESFGSQWFHVD